MLLSFLDCVLQALGSACVWTDGCAINLAVVPMQSLWCKPSTYLRGYFSQCREMCTKNRKTKIPQAAFSDHTILCFYFKKKNAEVQTESPCSVHLPADDSRSSFSPSFAKNELGNEWHLKARDGLLTPDFVWRSLCNSLWFRDVFIISILNLWGG